MYYFIISFIDFYKCIFNKINYIINKIGYGFN